MSNSTSKGELTRGGSGTRRAYLGTVAGGVLATVAGCSALGGDGGSSISQGGSPPQLVADWTPAADVPSRVLTYVDHDALDSVRDALPEEFTPLALRGSIEQSSTTAETLELAYGQETCQVWTGDIEAEAAGNELRGSAGTVDDREEFTVFGHFGTGEASGPIDPAYAISDDYVVSTSEDPEYLDVATLLDTYHGSSPSAEEDDADVATLLERTNESTAFELATYEDRRFGSSRTAPWSDQPDAIVGHVVAYTFGSDRTDVSIAWLYPDGHDVDRESFESFLDRERPVAAYENTSVATQGRLAIVEGSVPTERFNYLRRKEPVPDDSPIDAQFRFQPDDDSVQIQTSTANYISGPNRGEPIIDRIVVDVDGEERISWERGEEFGSPWTVSVERGDVITITGEVPEGTTATVRYHV